MSLSEWTVLKSHIQGDVSYRIRKSAVTPEYVDFELISFSEKWQQFDIAFEYRSDERDEWEEDAYITSTTATYLMNNKLYGLSATKDGEEHLIRWKYINNGILNGSTPQIRARIIPRVRVFSCGTDNYSISSIYGDRFVDFGGISEHNCIGIDNNGKYMCVNATSFYILESLSALTSEALYSYLGLVDPNFAININNGKYIVCDVGNDRVIELTYDLSSITKTYIGGGAEYVFVEYSEEDETILMTGQISNQIIEITWSDIDDGTLIWESLSLFNYPQSAKYKQDTVDELIIADTNNNRVVKYDRANDIYSNIYHYRLSSTYNGPYEMSQFNLPYRACWYSNGDICIVEKQGKQLGFETIVSSSSSSSSSSSYGYSTSSSSSSDSSSSLSSSSESSNDNRTVFEIAGALGQEIGITYEGAVDFFIAWGDGSWDAVNGNAEIKHTYSSGSGDYTLIFAQGECTRFAFTTGPAFLVEITSPIRGLNGITSFADSFFNTSITSLPYGLFDNCTLVTNFQNCFRNTDIVSIPSDLFNNCSNVTNFIGCFFDCTALLSLPSGLFGNCTSAIDFSFVCNLCGSLTSIASDVFDNCANVTNFQYAFASCVSLTSIPVNLFTSCINVVNFNQCFASCIALTGNAPTLWEQYGEISSNDCFINDTNLTNWASIPANWGGPAPIQCCRYSWVTDIAVGMSNWDIPGANIVNLFGCSWNVSLQPLGPPNLYILQGDNPTTGSFFTSDPFTYGVPNQFSISFTYSDSTSATGYVIYDGTIPSGAPFILYCP